MNIWSILGVVLLIIALGINLTKHSEQVSFDRMREAVRLELSLTPCGSSIIEKRAE